MIVREIGLSAIVDDNSNSRSMYIQGIRGTRTIRLVNLDSNRIDGYTINCNQEIIINIDHLIDYNLFQYCEVHYLEATEIKTSYLTVVIQGIIGTPMMLIAGAIRRSDLTFKSRYNHNKIIKQFHIISNLRQ